MCEICRQTPCNYRCPNYIPPHASLVCAFCEKGIYPWDTYVENYNRSSIHIDCVDRISDLVTWLGFDVKIMGDND